MLNGDDILSAGDQCCGCAHHLVTAVAARGGGAERLRWKRQAPPRSVGHLGLYVGLKGTRQQLGLEQANLWVYRDYDHDASIARFLAAQPRFPADVPLLSQRQGSGLG